MLHELKVKTNAGPGVLSVRQRGRNFEVLALTLKNDEHASFGFDPGSATEVLDSGSDALQCFNIACRVRYGDVILGNQDMRAVCLEDLAAALTRVKIRCYNPEEI